jgi:hypothetical protein
MIDHDNGGSYIVQKDGSLKRVEEIAAAPAEAPAEAEIKPAGRSAAKKPRAEK